jgi:hypothetical protein
MLFSDPPARIETPGTFPFARSLNAVYTVGHDFVQPALAELFRRTTRVSCDIETFGVGMAGRRLKSVAFGDDQASIVLDPRDPYQADLVRKAFIHADEYGFWYSMFDVPNLYLNGLLRFEDIEKCTDPLLYARLAEPGARISKSLEEAGDRYLKTGKGGQLQKAFKALGLNRTDGFKLFDLDRPIYLQGAASDPLITHRLWDVVKQAAYAKITTGHPFGAKGVSGQEAWDLVERENILNRKIKLPRTCLGYRVDFEFLDRYQADNAAEIATTEAELKEMGIRPGVSQDLAKALDARGEMPPGHPHTKNGGFAMGKELVEKIPHPMARKFLRHKEVQHIEKDYLNKCVEMADENGRVHAQTNLLLAATGRESISEPPFHQFNGPARGIILPDEDDTFTSIDLSQGEPVTIANACQDMDVLIGYEAGTSDLYTGLGIGAGMLPAGTTTADCERDKAKKVIRARLKQALLAQLYGQGLPLLTAKLGLDPGPYKPPSDWEIEVRKFDPDVLYPQYREARLLREAVFTAMPKTEIFIKKLKNIAAQTKLMMTVAGRIVDIPSSKRNGQWSVETHKGVNYFCQGGQYDIVADAQIRIIQAGLHEALYITMHDEFVVSSEAAADIRKILETPSERLCMWAQRTPILRTDMKYLGERWADA